MDITMKDVCDKLREGANILASGERETINVNLDQLSLALDESDVKKLTPSYVRTIMNRVAAVKEIGSVKITRLDVMKGDDFNGYQVTLCRESKRKVFTDKDLPGIKQKAVEKAINHILDVMPNISDLDGEQLQGAAISIKRYQDLIRSLIGDNE